MCQGNVVVRKRGLARKLASSVAASIVTGLCLVLAIYVILILDGAPQWGADAKEAMIKLEQLNMERLALEKARHATEVLSRVGEGLLQLQAFGEQVLLMTPQSMAIDNYLESFPGLLQDMRDWRHSSWYITGLNTEASFPAVGSSLDGLLNRTALMDVPFRGMQRQEELIYLAALDDPSLPDDPNTSVATQVYPAFDMLEAGFSTFDEVCDDRFDTGDNDFSPTSFDPRCRVWFQDAREKSRHGETIFTDPYVSLGTEALTVTSASPVYAVDGTTLLGVIGADTNFVSIEASIKGLRVVGEEGYAYLLTATGGSVAVHPKLDAHDGIRNISDLEEGVDGDEFADVVGLMTRQCKGSTKYQKDGDTWLISWEHEKASGSGYGTVPDCPKAGFIVAVTVNEAALLRMFSKTESNIRAIVMVASIVLISLVAIIVCFTIALARSVSAGLTNPVTQLVDIVKGLNRLDFSRQDAGLWIVEEVRCPEVEELMGAFKGMATIVKFANLTLGRGDLEAAYQGYHDALILFTKLDNSRGVGIVRNNLGSVYTLQARALSQRAGVQRARGDHDGAKDLKVRADEKYGDAADSFRLAVEDAEILIEGLKQLSRNDSPPRTPRTEATLATSGGGREEKRECEASPQECRPGDIDAVEAQNIDGCDGDTITALATQLANRKFNLALCLAAKVTGGDPCDGETVAAIDEALRLMNEFEALAAERNDALGRERRVEGLLAFASLARSQPDRRGNALDALERADGVIAAAGWSQEATAVSDVTAAPPAVLRQRLLAARAENSLAAGHHEAAVECWTEAIVGCGDVMDASVVRSSLINLKAQASFLLGQGDRVSEGLICGLGLSREGEGATKREITHTMLTKAIDEAAEKLGSSAFVSEAARVDLCFVMDCTSSMSAWIEEAKKKLFAIIEQTRKEADNLELRVAFVGYRDFDDRSSHCEGPKDSNRPSQYEGPYDFHSEAEFPQLEAKLRNIAAGGGCGNIADVAGGLQHATRMSWSSPLRLCILFAGAPCHGKNYHDVEDAYPDGCSGGVDPARTIYNLQSMLGVDFFFIRVAKVTDKMVALFQEKVRRMAAEDTRDEEESTSTRKRSSPNIKQGNGRRFLVHDLGSNDNSLVDTVADSVKVSSGINLRLEKYL